MKRQQSIVEYIIILAFVGVLITVAFSFLTTTNKAIENTQQQLSDTLNGTSAPSVIEEPVQKESHVGRTILIILGIIVGVAVAAASGIASYFFVHYRNYKKLILTEAERCRRALDVREQLETQLGELKLKDRYIDRMKVVDSKTNAVAHKISMASQIDIVSFVKERTWKERSNAISEEINAIYTTLQEVEQGISSSYFSQTTDGLSLSKS